MEPSLDYIVTLLLAIVLAVKYVLFDSSIDEQVLKDMKDKSKSTQPIDTSSTEDDEEPRTKTEIIQPARLKPNDSMFILLHKICEYKC